MEKYLCSFGAKQIKDLWDPKIAGKILFAFKDQKNGKNVIISASGFSEYDQISENFDEVQENPKSISHESTFKKSKNEENLTNILISLAKETWGEVSKQNLEKKARTLTVKIKNSNFRVFQKSKTVPSFFKNEEEIIQICKQIFQEFLPAELRLIGVKMSNFEDQEDKKAQKSILEFFSKSEKKRKNGEEEEGSGDSNFEIMEPNGVTNCLEHFSEFEKEGKKQKANEKESLNSGKSSSKGEKDAGRALGEGGWIENGKRLKGGEKKDFGRVNEEQRSANKKTILDFFEIKENKSISEDFDKKTFQCCSCTLVQKFKKNQNKMCVLCKSQKFDEIYFNAQEIVDLT